MPTHNCHGYIACPKCGLKNTTGEIINESSKEMCVHCLDCGYFRHESKAFPNGYQVEMIETHKCKECNSGAVMFIHESGEESLICYICED